MESSQEIGFSISFDHHFWRDLAPAPSCSRKPLRSPVSSCACVSDVGLTMTHLEQRQLLDSSKIEWMPLLKNSERRTRIGTEFQSAWFCQETTQVAGSPKSCNAQCLQARVLCRPPPRANPRRIQLKVQAASLLMKQLVVLPRLDQRMCLPRPKALPQELARQCLL